MESDRLANLSDSIEDSGFKKDTNENELKHVQRFINKKISKD